MGPLGTLHCSGPVVFSNSENRSDYVSTKECTVFYCTWVSVRTAHLVYGLRTLSALYVLYSQGNSFLNLVSNGGKSLPKVYRVLLGCIQELYRFTN